MQRAPAVAGIFYDAGKENLTRSIESCFLSEYGPGKLPQVKNGGSGRIIGLVCPHAGYIYSGAAAACSYNALAEDGLPEVAIIIGPNHSGMGPAVSVSGAKEWSTPLGEIDLDTEMIDAILQSSEFVQLDDRAHAREHSIEVQVPFLQYLGGNSIRIVPICIAHLGESDALALSKDLGPAIAKAAGGRSAVIIASTDFTHYEPQSSAEVRDAEAMEQIFKLDAEGLLRVVYGKSITMCGVIGTAVMLEAAKGLGAISAKKLIYYTSGDITGDTSQVVGYGALSITK